MVHHMIIYNHKEVKKRMSRKKKKKKKESLFKLAIELLIAVGTFLAGLASLIQALK